MKVEPAVSPARFPLCEEAKAEPRRVKIDSGAKNAFILTDRNAKSKKNVEKTPDFLKIFRRPLNDALSETAKSTHFLFFPLNRQLSKTTKTLKPFLSPPKNAAPDENAVDFPEYSGIPQTLCLTKRRRPRRSDVFAQ